MRLACAIAGVSFALGGGVTDGSGRVIDVDARRAIVHSDPGPDRYAQVETVGPDGELAAPHVDVKSISLAELFSVL